MLLAGVVGVVLLAVVAGVVLLLLPPLWCSCLSSVHLQRAVLSHHCQPFPQRVTLR